MKNLPEISVDTQVEGMGVKAKTVIISVQGTFDGEHYFRKERKIILKLNQKTEEALAFYKLLYFNEGEVPLDHKRINERIAEWIITV